MNYLFDYKNMIFLFFIIICSLIFFGSKGLKMFIPPLFSAILNVILTLCYAAFLYLITRNIFDGKRLPTDIDHILVCFHILTVNIIFFILGISLNKYFKFIPLNILLGFLILVYFKGNDDFYINSETSVSYFNYEIFIQYISLTIGYFLSLCISKAPIIKKGEKNNENEKKTVGRQGI